MTGVTVHIRRRYGLTEPVELNDARSPREVTVWARIPAKIGEYFGERHSIHVKECAAPISFVLMQCTNVRTHQNFDR